MTVKGISHGSCSRHGFGGITHGVSEEWVKRRTQSGIASASPERVRQFQERTYRRAMQSGFSRRQYWKATKTAEGALGMAKVKTGRYSPTALMLGAAIPERKFDPKKWGSVQKRMRTESQKGPKGVKPPATGGGGGGSSSGGRVRGRLTEAQAARLKAEVKKAVRASGVTLGGGRASYARSARTSESEKMWQTGPRGGRFYMKNGVKRYK